MPTGNYESLGFEPFTIARFHLGTDGTPGEDGAVAWFYAVRSRIGTYPHGAAYNVSFKTIIHVVSDPLLAIGHLARTLDANSLVFICAHLDIFPCMPWPVQQGPVISDIAHEAPSQEQRELVTMLAKFWIDWGEWLDQVADIRVLATELDPAHIDVICRAVLPHDRCATLDGAASPPTRPPIAPSLTWDLLELWVGADLTTKVLHKAADFGLPNLPHRQGQHIDVVDTNDLWRTLRYLAVAVAITCVVGVWGVAIWGRRALGLIYERVPRLHEHDSLN